MDNGTIGEKGKKKSLLQLFLLLKQHVLEFTRCSSLHGLRYIGEAQRPKIEKIEDFEKAKIICRNFIDFGIDITDYFPLGYEPDNSTTLEGMDDFLGRVGPLMGEMLDLCRWRRNTIDCADIFQPVITDNGLCYTANNLNAQQMFKVGTVQRQSYSLQHPNMTLWSYEDQKYKDTDEIDVYPQRALTSGSSGGLVLLISLMKEDTDRLCTPPIYDNFSSDDNGMEYCYCLPGCTEIKYDIEISQAVFKPYETLHALYAWSSALGIDNRTTNGNDTEDMVSSVAFYYKDNQFVTSHRSELYGPIDFLASCGGLLGLYLGFSFLSLVEIIYFFTMRLVSNVMAERRHSE
ncbi:hypothetical protein C0J52_20178 [Blattella germanica]|nr:hypothetical protein C0J52_20178 [Blattella germanica]